MIYPINVPAIKIYQGDTFSQSYVFKDKETKAVRDLVADGWGSWLAQWRPFAGSKDFVNFTIDSESADEGRIGISLTGDQTTQLRGGVWDLQALQGTDRRTWISGTVEFVKEVSHG